MAEGRMLKKLISTSKKLANLKTDSARLLYTWIIPHVDIKGRFSGEPDIVKGYIVPRLKTMDYDKIEGYLADMHENNLINLYEVNGDKYLEIIKFNEFQTLRADRESTSNIPAPAVLRESSGGTPAQAKRNEGKLSETKRSQDKGSEVKPVSSFSPKDRISFASEELKFYDLTQQVFGCARKSDKTTLQNVAKFLSVGYEFDCKIFSKAYEVAQECKKTGNRPIALFMSRMKDEFQYRKPKC
jgi:hypothetical protein